MEISDMDGAVETLKLLEMSRRKEGKKGKKKTHQEQSQNEQFDRES